MSASAAAPIKLSAPPPMLCRDEIIDVKGRLCGYRFSLHSGDTRVPMPETEFVEALVSERIPEFAARRIAMVSLSLDAILFKRHEPLVAPNTVFIFDRRQVNMPAAQLAGRMAALKELGCKVALRGVTLEKAELPLYEACDIVLLHLGDCSLQQFQLMIKQFRALFPKLEIGADGVDSWDEQRMCHAWGIQYFLGEFLTKPDKIDPDGSIDQGRLTAMEMLNLLRADAEIDELTEVAKKDPGLTFQVLKWANSSSNGQQTKITSLGQAITVLGRSQLYRGLTVSMFRQGKNKERDEALLEVALTRARFLETVSKNSLNLAERDEIFLVGLLSMFDLLLGIPMQRILEKMQLSEDVVEVLMRSGGRYGPYLMLALQIQRGMTARAADIASSIGIDPDSLNDTSQAAFKWAQASLKHGGE